ncbi:efflux ABC transporter, permease protein [Prevotella sp. DNF00663]|uniref:ABC transporter permease n=1 Tax=unclassified Prevotella TaxID=2638335 RepID=UPI000513EE45|nr:MULTISPECIES: ABC transporter permease [unclassified Prevotella]KGI60936.1 ABC transporter ATP-binding protein [Prevotella sp. S7 MS 2]KXB81922.1 efflux ABC transporter, permease protein [Prevotella sp. DNF00663]
MRIDLDTYKEILDTLTRNKSRSFLTGFGIFWGVFMLVALIGGGNGMKEMLSKNFSGFASNSAIIFAQNTTKAYAGYRKGRSWYMDYKDVERLKAQIPEIDIVSPMLSQWGRFAVVGDKKASCTVKGLQADYVKVEEPQIYYGRYLNQMDIQQGRKVCVIGKKVYKTLFPNGGDPCGQLVRIDSIYYNIVGVDYSTGNISINGSTQESVIIPITMMRQAYNTGDQVHLICVTGKRGVKMGEITNRMREVVARAHRVDPTDEKAITIFNTEVMFGMVDNLFQGVNFLIWLVGIGTLLAGAIGVSNIMMVTVRERTTEIGIRRAIGATPCNILGQIISESVLLTAVAGMSGILFAVLILQLLEMGNTTGGVVSAHFQVGFWTALGATVFISILGVLAGLAPAGRAMSIKPVDAMRDE